MKFSCPHCQQHLEADDSFAGTTVDCPTCGKSFVVGAVPAAEPPPPVSVPVPDAPPVPETPERPEPESVPPPPVEPPPAEPPKAAPKFHVVSRPLESAPERPKSAPKFRVVSRSPKTVPPGGTGFRNGATEKKVTATLHERFNDFAGLEKIEGFSLSDLLSEIFGKHKPEEVEEFFTVGTPRATPSVEEVDTSWPRPWLFFRALAASILMYLLFAGSYESFGNLNLIPGLMLMGTLAVPFSTLLFFYEANVRRNISLYQVLRLFFFGGILSLIVTLVIYSLVGDAPKGILAEAAPGPIEEIGKLLALLLVARSSRYPYKLNGLLMGAAIGTGFAMFESMGYALNGLLEGVVVETLEDSQSLIDGPVAYMRGIIVLRGVLSPLGHIVWTAIAGAALWRVKGTQPFRFSMLGDGKFWHLFLIPVVLHALWDTSIPYVDALPYYGKYLLLGFVAWFVAIALVQEGLKELRAEKLAALESQSADVEDVDNESHGIE